MERKYLKAINFDLSVHEMEKYYQNHRKAYHAVKSFLKNRDVNTGSAGNMNIQVTVTPMQNHDDC